MKDSGKNTALEQQVKGVLDEYVMGTLDLGGRPPTATCIARVVSERYNVVASPGGVHNIFVKWEKMGFITFAFEGRRPLTFEGYTDDAREIGLARIKARYYSAREKSGPSSHDDHESATVSQTNYKPANQTEE
jgi:hypothetical protein